MIIIACFVGMGVGINSLTSRKLGEKDYASVRATAEHVYFIASLLYVTIAMLGLLTSRMFFEWFTDDPSIIEYGSGYLQIINVILLPFAYLLSKLGNIDVIWYAFIAAELIGVIAVLIFFRQIYKRRIESL
ncbi:MAG: hypothetical protein IBX70_05620 [Clostridia bacterium]|nr:hypothetical protein [Clostridia bacterium]